MLSWFFGRGGHREESQNDSESISNDANSSTINQLQAELEANSVRIIKEQDALIIQLKREMESKSAENENLKKEVKATASSMQFVIRAKNVKIREQEKLLSSFVDNKEIANQNSLVAQLKSEVESKSAGINKLQKELESTNSSLQEAKTTITLLMECLVSPSNPVEMKGEAKENGNTTETTIRAKFTEITKLSDARVYSQPTYFDGIIWHSFVRKSNDHLEVRLNGRKPNAAKWSCAVRFKFQLISQKDEKIVYVGDSGVAREFNEDNNWGFDNFISFKDLLNEKKGYVKDDSIILVVVIKPSPSTEEK